MTTATETTTFADLRVGDAVWIWDEFVRVTSVRAFTPGTIRIQFRITPGTVMNYTRPDTELLERATTTKGTP